MRRSPLVYRALLGLFPAAFRREYGPDMEQLARDRLLEVTGRPVAWCKLWFALLADVVANIVREWGRVIAGETQDLMREGMGMDGWIQDLRFGARSLWRRPGFALAAVLTLALGIGANVSMFSVVNSVLLSPLPYPEPDDLMVVWTVNKENGQRKRTLDHPDVRAIQAQLPDLAVSGYAGTRPTLTGFGVPEVLFGARVTDGLIDVLGLTPVLGRDLQASDDIPDGPRVLVISHSFWTSRLGRNADVLGSMVELNGEPWEVVGVAPEGFDYPDGSELWMPRQHDPEGCGHGCRIMSAIARVAPGGTLPEVQSRLDAMSAGIASDFPDAHEFEGFKLDSMLDNEVADVRTALWILLGAVGMVLLIACANVANLMLVRASGRTAEVALRATLGASRLRIIRQLLTEAALLSLAAGLAGLALAYWGTTALTALAPDVLPRLDGPVLDTTVLGFAALLVVVVTGLFGVLPALQLGSQSLMEGVGRGDRTIGHSQGGRSRSALLVVEMALSLTLLLGTGLLLRTLAEIRAVDLGFETTGIERFRISVPDSRYDSLQIVAVLGEIEVAMNAIPGVQAAGMGFGVPLSSGGIFTSARALDVPELRPQDRLSIDFRPSSVGFLRATGTTLVRGRWFDQDDVYGAQGVAVINESAVRMHFPDRDPLGLMMQADVSWSFAETPPLMIIGIVEDVVKAGPTDAPVPAMYIPNAQFGANSAYVSLRLRPGTASVIPEARKALAALDPSLAIWNATTMDEVVSGAHAATTFYATLLTAFSVVALLLASVGLYGVVAYTVSQRTREIGIRIALGAASDQVVSMILRQGFKPALGGIALGLIISWFGARVLGSLLFEVSPQDPLTLVSVTLLLIGVAAIATTLPARRASRIPAASALRAE